MSCWARWPQLFVCFILWGYASCYSLCHDVGSFLCCQTDRSILIWDIRSCVFVSLPYLPLTSKMRCHPGSLPLTYDWISIFRSFNWISGVKHEAGYDAFMTGCIFAQACSYLGIDLKLDFSSQALAHSEKLQKYVNLLYLSWINGDIIDLSTGNRIESSGPSNLKKLHSKILFENIVLIWRFPSKLKAAEIKECISKVFGPTSVTSVYHVDETAVFVQFSKSEFVSDFLLLKDSLERTNDMISVLHPLAKLLEGGNTCAAGYETYKEICSSPISKFLFADQAEAMGITWKTKLVESKVEAQTQEQESSSEGNATGAESVSVETNKTGKKHLVQDSSSGRSSYDEVIDSFYTVEVKRVRATNL